MVSAEVKGTQSEDKNRPFYSRQGGYTWNADHIHLPLSGRLYNKHTRRHAQTHTHTHRAQPQH